MRCPACGETTSKVVDSRPSPDGTEIRRRRACEACGQRFTTFERSERQVPLVVKRDGRREPWDEDKLRAAIQTACRKRAVPAQAIDRIVAGALRAATDGGEREVSSEVIGEALLQQLREVDEVAYARFASVYRRFQTLRDFATLADPDEG